MENFILWSVSSDEKINQLSFFATSVQIQRINKGTQEMVAKMLNDLSSPEVSVEEWSIDNFLTDYLMDYPPSDNWEDIWSDTYEIKLQLSKPIKLEVKNTDLIRTFAHDETWEGEPLHFPIKCVVVADFYDFESLAKAKSILDRVGKLRENTSLIDELHSQVPHVPKQMFQNIYEAFLELGKYQEKTSSELSVRQRAGNPLQLILNIGVFGEEFFIDDTPLANWVSDLVHKLGGTTTWDERTDPDRLS
ncbi:MAG TPA: hypothetical protein DCL61_19825 [Cyanobacteria bacterium UBA12227]|nr:hypothetical protein [Cyanobacteria bacterium UBA12227]HAX90574.1 hypothetical protein [Cyanobacteria bacterium UBA11370]HBY81280.1 hypothetical protein [Cyanobacteria bacterium UBA11148]